VNCDSSLPSTNAAAAASAVAWHWHCRACAELAAGQMDLTADQPEGLFIQIYRCRRCGMSRSCRPGWQTRCHVCLDERSSGLVIIEAAQRFRAMVANDPGLQHQARLLAAAPGHDADRAAVEASAALAVATAVRRAERPGWEVVAADVHGLPWTGGKTGSSSHGTWARHQACGIIAKLRPGSLDCPACGSAVGSRTHLARRDNPYLLYLVVHRRWQKFGIGDHRRVQAHQRGGAQVIQVLRAPFDTVEVTGSIPVSPTSVSAGQGPYSVRGVPFGPTSGPTICRASGEPVFQGSYPGQREYSDSTPRAAGSGAHR
jgi:hypothetical protein